MQVCEQHLAVPKLLAFGREWLLDLHDQFRLGEYPICIHGDLGACSHVGFIRETGATAGVLLDKNVMTFERQFAHRRWHEPHTEFAVLDLRGHTDQHHSPQDFGRSIGKTNSAIRKKCGSHGQSSMYAVSRWQMCAARSFRALYLAAHPGMTPHMIRNQGR